MLYRLPNYTVHIGIMDILKTVQTAHIHSGEKKKLQAGRKKSCRKKSFGQTSITSIYAHTCICCEKYIFVSHER